MGAGAIGSYFGGRLAAAGEEVHFIGAGVHICRQWLRTDSRSSAIMATPILKKSTPRPTPNRSVQSDMILFCVKLWDLDRAAEQIKPMLKADTAVYSFQNGIYAEGRLAELLGPQHVIGGYAATPVTVIEPGVVRQFGEWCTLGFGELDNRRTPRVERFLAACQRANIDSLIEQDVLAALWMKFIFITTHSSGTSFCRSTEGPIRSDVWGRQMLVGLASEGTAIARAKGINIAADNAEHVLEQIGRVAARRAGVDVHRPATRQSVGTGVAEWPHGQAR